MTKNSHIIISNLTGLTLYTISGYTFSIFYIFYPLFGILPDLDNKTFFGKTLPIKHRTYTHTLYFPIIISLLIFIVSYFLGYTLNFYDIIVIIVGILSHLIGDIVTKNGIDIVYPYGNKTNLNNYTTGLTNIIQRGKEFKITFFTSIIFLFLIIFNLEIIQNYSNNLKDFLFNYDLLSIFFISLYFFLLSFLLKKEILNFKKEFLYNYKNSIVFIILTCLLFLFNFYIENVILNFMAFVVFITGLLNYHNNDIIRLGNNLSFLLTILFYFLLIFYFIF